MQNHEPIWFNKKPVKKSKYRLFVATPCHSEVSIHYTQSVLELQKTALRNNVSITFTIFKSSLVTQGRNLCVSGFLESDCTHLLFIDSDIAFKAQSAFNLLYADKDVISIPYPLKDMNWDKAMHMFKEGKIKTADDLKTKAFYRYPMKVPHDQKIHVKKGIIEVTHSPTGFMMIKREVFDKMIKAYPNFYIKQLHVINGKPIERPHMWNFFDTLHDPESKTYMGEDFAFCKRWKDIGGSCHAWVMDQIIHVGEHQYTGRFGDELILSE
jgi:hypothetical protein